MRVLDGSYGGLAPLKDRLREHGEPLAKILLDRGQQQPLGKSDRDKLLPAGILALVALPAGVRRV